MPPNSHQNAQNRQETTTTETLTETEQLHLRGSPDPPEIDELNDIDSLTEPAQRHAVRWEEGTIDNENMNKKKSKICCIFHPQRDFDDEECEECHSSSSSSSSPSSSSSCSSRDSSDAEGDPNSAAKKKKKSKLKRVPSPNSYEKQPTYKHQNHLHPHNH